MEKQSRQPHATGTHHLGISASFSGTNWLSLPQRLLTRRAWHKGWGWGWGWGGYRGISLKRNLLFLFILLIHCALFSFLLRLAPSRYFFIFFFHFQVRGCYARESETPNWTSRSRSNVSTRDQSRRKALCGQDKRAGLYK